MHRFHAHPRALDRLAAELIGSGATQGVGGLGPVQGRVDGYASPAALRRLVQRYRLQEEPGGTVTVRVTDTPTAVIADLAAGRRRVLAGLDLAGSIDPRERAAGQRILDRALDGLRG